MDELADVICAAYHLVDVVEQVETPEQIIEAQRALEIVAERLASVAARGGATS